MHCWKILFSRLNAPKYFAHICALETGGSRQRCEPRLPVVLDNPRINVTTVKRMEKQAAAVVWCKIGGQEVGAECAPTMTAWNKSYF